MAQKKSAAKKRLRPAPKTYHTYNPEKDTASLQVNALPDALRLFKPSWQALMLNLMETCKLVLIPVFMAVVSLLLVYIGRLHHGTQMEAICNGLAAVSGLGAIGLLVAILPAFGLIQLKSVRNQEAEFWEEFLAGLPLAWRFLAVNLVVGIIAAACLAILLIIAGYAAENVMRGEYVIGIAAAIAMILLVKPALFPIQRLILAQYYILDYEIGVFEALRRSAADARTYNKALWGLVSITLCIRLIGVLTFVGLLIALVLQTLYLYAPAVRYAEIQAIQRRKTALKSHR